jgi:4-amino-4-deoxy-L-arabinose transferase-like glycosyltransferase
LIPALRRQFARSEQLIAWWTVVPFVFFSLAGSKLPGYILPMVPPIALLCAKELLRSTSRTYRVAVYIEAGTMAFIGVGFGFYGPMLNVDPHVSGVLIAVVAFALASLLALIALFLAPRYLVAFNVTTIVAIVMMATSFVFSRFDKTETMRPWDQALEQIVPAGETVFMYKPARWMEYGLQFYRYNSAIGVGSPEELSKLTADRNRVVCIAEDESLDELTKHGNLEIKVVHTIGHQTAFWVWRSPPGLNQD